MYTRGTLDSFCRPAHLVQLVVGRLYKLDYSIFEYECLEISYEVDFRPLRPVNVHQHDPGTPWIYLGEYKVIVTREGHVHWCLVLIKDNPCWIPMPSRAKRGSIQRCR